MRRIYYLIYIGNDKLLSLEETLSKVLEKLTAFHRLTEVVREKAEFDIPACS